jgi:Holliday junction resolvase
MGKINSRAKGKAGERELINELKVLLPPELTSELTRNLDQTRDGGHDILGLDGWALEVKRYAEVLPADLERFWQQATEQARKYAARPALAFRQDRRPWRVVVRMSDVGLIKGDEYEYTVEMSLQLFAEIIVMHARLDALIISGQELENV